MGVAAIATTKATHLGRLRIWCSLHIKWTHRITDAHDIMRGIVNYCQLSCLGYTRFLVVVSPSFILAHTSSNLITSIYFFWISPHHSLPISTFTLVPQPFIMVKLALKDSRHLHMMMDLFTCFDQMKIASGELLLLFSFRQYKSSFRLLLFWFKHISCMNRFFHTLNK